MDFRTLLQFSKAQCLHLWKRTPLTCSLCNLWFFVISYKVVIPGVISPGTPHCLRLWAYFHDVKSTAPGSRKVPRKSEGPPTLSYKRKYLVAKVHALSRQGGVGLSLCKVVMHSNYLVQCLVKMPPILTEIK